MSRKTKNRNQGKNGRFAASKKNSKRLKGVEYEGVGQMTRDGSLFVKVDGQEEDIYIRPGKTRGALTGDLVRIMAKAGKPRAGQKTEGEVLEILERSKKPFVGVLHRMGAKAWVLMQSKTMPYDIELDTGELASEAQSGYKVAAVVDDWPRGSEYPRGHVVDILGEMGKNDTEMHAILAEYGLPYKFEKAVADAADSIPDSIGPEEMKGRKDYRKTLTFTIDPADAKDFDDALSFVRLGNGNYEVGVHIADVSYYVKPGDLVDKEAQERGTSVYLVDRTVPMLPEKLSNKLCSLRPGEDKLTFSAVFEITPRGKVESCWLGRTAINSDYRFDYETAQKIIEKGKGKRDIDDAILTLWGLAKTFRDKRFKAGAISFERPEMKVQCDADGRPIAVSQHISKEANWLIEEFMLLANRSVAEWVATAGKMDGRERKDAKTFVYRVHDTPNLDKLGALGKFAGHFGYKTKFDDADSRKIAHKLNDLLEEAKDKPEFYPMEMIALRSMAKASYSTDNIGHYGLAFNFYTHFTSPIRRYPDLMVHRLLARYLGGGTSADKNYYEGQCTHASEREVIAANAERDSIKYKLVEFMQDKVDQEFDGRISGLTEWGMYVEIEPTKIEGMVSLRSIRSDFFDFDEPRYLIRGKRTRKIYRLGDVVRVRVKSTNLEQRLLDYELVENTR